MKVLITGGRGLLGRTLVQYLSPSHDVTSVDREDFDITDGAVVDAALSRARPQVVLHCAAMTDVDGAEAKPGLAHRVNAVGSAHVAAAADRVGARLIAFSTDYVFDGQLDRPYHEDDVPHPQTVYGASKLAGEQAIRAHCPNHLILRLAWLYGPGGPSFLHTMLRLGALPGPPIRVVHDQIGNPTSTEAVAERVAELLAFPATGIWHLTSEGEASWYEYAQAIERLAPLQRRILPCTTADFPRPARRPANSRLEKRALASHGLRPMDDWRVRLEAFFRSSGAGRIAVPPAA